MTHILRLHVVVCGAALGCNRVRSYQLIDPATLDAEFRLGAPLVEVEPDLSAPFARRPQVITGRRRIIIGLVDTDPDLVGEV